MRIEDRAQATSPPPHAWHAPSILSFFVIVAALSLSGCGTVFKRGAGSPKVDRIPPVAGAPDKRGGYYQDDGPGENPPPNLDQVPDAVPKVEPLRSTSNRPYVALGKSYTPETTLRSYKARGIASWYGRKYHGSKTSSGEIYDMYGMSAAHTTLPIPSYARVTNLKNNKSVVVRINDRGPFYSDRLIDLSYTAAYKLGTLAGGSAWVEVESILPGKEPETLIAAAPAPSPPEKAASEAPAGKTDLTRVLTATSDASGVYLQLGAFSARDNAENFLSKLQSRLNWLAETLSIFAKDGLFRVHLGPYADHAEARNIAEKIRQALDIKPMVLVR